MTTLYDYEKQSHQRTGYTESTTPSERFLVVRDFALIAVITLQLGGAILAIPTITTHQTATYLIKYLAVVITMGVIAPLFATLAFRDHISVGKFTCALWWELTWTFSVFFIDMVIAISYGTQPDASKTMTGLVVTQTLTAFLYFATLVLMTHFHRRAYPGISFWRETVQSICWLRSGMTVSPTAPMIRNLTISRPFYVASPPKQPLAFVAPWDQQYEDELEKIREREDEFKEVRLKEAEENLRYKMERYGLPSGPKVIGAGVGRSKTTKPVSKTEISKPLPMPPKRAFTLPRDIRFQRHYSEAHDEGGVTTTTKPVRPKHSNPQPIQLEFPTPSLSPIPLPKTSSSSGQRIYHHRPSASVPIVDSPTSVYPESLKSKDTPKGGLVRNLTLPTHRYNDQPPLPPLPKKIRTKRTWDTNEQH